VAKKAWKYVVEGPRWMGVKQFIKNESFILDLSLTQFEVDTGWIRETVRFEVTGEENNVKEFRELFVKALNDYNKRIEKDGIY
jgi:hypothetical protein